MFRASPIFFCFLVTGAGIQTEVLVVTQQVLLPTEPSLQHPFPVHLSILSLFQSPSPWLPTRSKYGPLWAFAHCVTPSETLFPVSHYSSLLEETTLIFKGTIITIPIPLLGRVTKHLLLRASETI